MILPTSLFSYDKETRTLTACASDGPLHSMFLPGKKVPEVMGIESSRTGIVISVNYLSRRASWENEIESWLYYNDEHDISVVIFND